MAKARLLKQQLAFTNQWQVPVEQQATITTDSQQSLLPLVSQHQDAFTLPAN